MIRRTITITSAVAVLFLLICIFAAGNIYAAQDLRLKTDKLDMDKTGIGHMNTEISEVKGCKENIKSVKMSKKGVVHVEDGLERSFFVTAVGKGDVVLTVTGDKGSVVELPVHVGAKGLKNALRYNTYIPDVYYGNPSAFVSTIPGAKISFKIGKSTSGKTMPDSKYFSEDLQTFKIKKMFNVGKKITVTVKKSGTAYTFTTKIKKNKYLFERVKASGKVLKVRLWNVEKGNTIKIRYAGKTYTRKVKKTRNDLTYINIKTKKTIRKNGKVSIKVQNKYKTVLIKKSFRLKGGKWIAPSPL